MATAPCTECQEAFSALVVVCPFCGARRAEGAMPPGRMRMVAREPVAPARPRRAPALRPCPQCGVSGVLVPLRVQVWRDAGVDEDGAGLWEVHGAELALQCAACARGLARGRRLASFLTALPVAVAAAIYMTSAWGEALTLWFGLLYGGYLLRWGSYTWADWLVYGRALKRQVFGSGPVAGKVRFPFEGPDFVWRIGFLAALGGVGAALGGVL